MDSQMVYTQAFPSSQRKRKGSGRGGPRRIRPRAGRRQVQGLGSVLCNLQRTFLWTTWTPSTTTTNDFWRFLNPTYANMPSSPELSAVFDMYRINGVKFTFRPRYDGFDGANTTDTTAPGVTNQGGTNVHYIVDPGSFLTPSGTYTSANLNNFLENGVVKSTTGNKPFSIYMKPTTNAATGSGPMKKTGQWLSTQTANDLAQNGVHVFMQDTNLTGTFGQAFDIFVTYYISFRGVR